MANFAPTIRPDNDPSYGGNSKIVDDWMSDKSSAVAMKGVGEALGNVVQGVDTFLASSAEDATRNAVESERQSFIDSLGGSSLVDSTGQDVPDGVRKGVDKVKALNQAYKSGKISESYYWARQDAIQKQMRAAYPGYRDHVDKAVSSVLGTTPANALQRSLQKDLADAQARQAATVDAQDRFLTTNAAYLRPGWEKRTFEQNKYDVIQNKMTEQHIKLSSARADLLAKDQNRNQDALLETLTGQVSMQQAGVVSDSVSTVLQKDGTVSGMNTTSPEENVGNSSPTAKQNLDMVSGYVLDLIRRQSKGEILPTDQIDLVRGKINELRTMASLQFDKTIAPYINVLDKTKVEAKRELLLSPYNALDKAVTDKQYGLLYWNEAHNQHSRDLATRTLLEGPNGEFFKRVDALHKALGPDLSKKFDMDLLQNQTVGHAMKLVVQDTVSRLATGDETFNLPDRLKVMYNNGVKDPQVYSAIWKGVDNMLAPEVPNEVKINAAKGLFDSGILSILKSEDQDKLLTKYTSPEFIKTMTDLKKFGSQGEQAFRNYFNFIDKAWVNVFANQHLKTIANVKERPYATVDYDPVKSKFTVTDTNPKVRGSLYESMRNSDLTKSVDWLNKSIENLKPLLQARGINPNDYFIRKALLAGWEGEGTKHSTWWTSFLKLYEESFKGPLTKDTKTKSDKPKTD